MTHARRQSRSADAASDRLAESRVLRRGQDRSPSSSASSTSATAAGAASACATRFPTLFDLIDESTTGEIDGVAKADFWKVVDQCYLCDLCYMTKCPYVPPHPWNVDFPHLMLRAKAVEVQAAAERRCATGCCPPPTRSASSRRSRSSCRSVNAARTRTPLRALVRERSLGVAPGRAGCRRTRRDRSARSAEPSGLVAGAATASARRARSRSSRPATSTTTSRASATTCSRPRPQRDPVRARREGGVLRHAEARARRPRSRSRGSRSSNIPRARAARARGLRDPDAGAVVHADVQAGAAAACSRTTRT